MGLSAHLGAGYTKKNPALDIACVIDAIYVRQAGLVTSRARCKHHG
jgi:hypothetical protein